MRNVFKLAMAVAVIGSGLVSQTALADTVLPTTANGELVLYAYYQVTVGTTTTTFSYARGTGQQINSIVGGDKTSLANDASYAAGNALSMSFSTLQHDANLTTFLNSAAAAGATVNYAVIGGDNTGADRNPGSNRYAVTSAVNYGTATMSVSNTNLTGQWNNVNSMQGAVNLAINTGVGLDKASTLDGQFGNAVYAAADMFGTSFVNNVAVGSSQSFYLVTGGAGLATGKVRDYLVGSFSMNATGDLSFVSAGSTSVPLPAAAWLFGSGLLGLAGVGRRKVAA
jgi:hypothetical protein